MSNPPILPATPEEMQRLLADPTLLAPEPLRTLLRRCAVVASFDAPLFDAVLSRDLPAVERAAPPADLFAALVSHPLIEALPAATGETQRYRLAASLQPQIFAAAWMTPAVAPGDPASVSPGLQALSQALADYYAERDAYEALYHRIAADQDAATRAFVMAYQRAEAHFDLPRCHALIRIFDSRSDILSGAVKRTVNQRRFRLDTRTQWATAYYSTALYFERTQTRGLLGDLLSGPQWLLHLYAPGGTGKSMYIRHLIARRCVRARIPVAYVDFDHVLRPEQAVAEPWRLLISLIDQLNPQIEGRPFGEVLAAYASYQHPLEASALIQMRAPVTVTEDEAQRLRNELIGRIASALNEVRGERPVILIFDTLENLRQRRQSLTATFQLLCDLHAQCPALRVILAGRYDLAEGDPGPEDDQTNAYRKLLGDQPRVRLEAFTKEEARTYLTTNRRLSDTARVDAILLRARSEPSDDASRINPFKLSLLADLVAYSPDVTAATILAYEAADTAYLIERVVDRIEHRLVRFVLRYGVVPRFLTRDYLTVVLQPYLATIAAGDTSLDDPQADDLHVEVLRRQPFSLKEQEGAPVDVGALWTELTSFTSYHSWVTPVGSDVVRFHPDVVGPMLRLLRRSRQPVLQALHCASADYCTHQADQQPEQRARWLSEAVYHRLAAGDVDVLACWRATWAATPGASAPTAPALLAQETLALLDEPIAEPNVDPALTARQQDLRSLVAFSLAFTQLAELAPGELRRLLALAEAGDPAMTQIAPADLAIIHAQLDLSEGRSKTAESTARQAIVDLGDRVNIGGVVVMKAVHGEAARIIAAASVAQGEHGQAIATLRAALAAADPPEQLRILGELAALYEQQGDWLAAADACLDLRTVAAAQQDPLRVAAAVTNGVRLLTATGQEAQAAELATTTQAWLTARTGGADPNDRWRDLWLAGRMAAEAYLAAQQPGAAQLELDRLASHEGVQQFLKQAASTPDGAARHQAELDLRARVAAACLDSSSAIDAYEQIADDIAGTTPQARAAALLTAANLAIDVGALGRATDLLAGVSAQPDDPAAAVERQLVAVRLHLATGAGAEATALLQTLAAAAVTPPQRVQAARLRVLATAGAPESWAALIEALAQLGAPAWCSAALMGLASVQPPAADQAAHLRDLARSADSGPPVAPLVRLRLANLAAITGATDVATAELAAVQQTAVERQQWRVLREVYVLWDAVGWPAGALAAAPLPPADAEYATELFLVAAIWLEHGLRLIEERADLAQGAELVERAGTALGTQAPWLARVLLGRASVALARGEDGRGRQLAEAAAAAFTAQGDAPSAQRTRSLMALTEGAPAQDFGAPTTPDAVAAAATLELELTVRPDALWQVTARRGGATVEQWQPVLDARMQQALTLRTGEIVGAQFVTAFTTDWLGWAVALGQLATTAAVRAHLTTATAPGDLRWQLPPALAWLPWELLVFEDGAAERGPQPFALTPACRFIYRTTAPPQLAPPAPDAPVLVVSTSDVASRVAQRGYGTFGETDLLRRYQGTNLAAYAVSENTLDGLARMVQELRPGVVHIAAGLVESGRRAGLNISGDTGMRKVAPRPLVAADLKQIFGGAGIAPLLILDPPAPPGLSERVRQLCLRNAFAAEAAASGVCRGILAAGLGDPVQQEDVARILVSGVAERLPLGEILRRLWLTPGAATALAELLPFVGAALFAEEDDVRGDR